MANTNKSNPEKREMLTKKLGPFLKIFIWDDRKESPKNHIKESSEAPSQKDTFWSKYSSLAPVPPMSRTVSM